MFVGRSFARLALADRIARSPNCTEPRRHIFATLKARAERFPMSGPGRIERRPYASLYYQSRLIVRDDHEYLRRWLKCAICGGDLKSPRLSSVEPEACERCRYVGRANLYRIAGATECNRLRLSLERGEYTEPTEETWHMQTTTDLRRELIADLDALKSGAITRAEARVRANIAKQIIDTVKVECVAMTLGTNAPVPVNFSGAQPTAIAAE